MQENLGVVENRLNRAAHCVKKMQSAMRQITSIEATIEDLQMAIEADNQKSRHAVENCAGKRGSVNRQLVLELRYCRRASDMKMTRRQMGFGEPTTATIALGGLLQNSGRIQTLI